MPVMNRSNLTVEIRALAHRVLTDGKRAVGVEYSQDGTLHQVRARREVLLAGGAINSPQLLPVVRHRTWCVAAAARHSGGA